MSASQSTSLAARFVHALSTFDADVLEQVLAPDATAWRNVGNRTRTAQEILASTQHERELVASSALRVRQQSATDDGFVLQLVLEGVTRGGRDLTIPICLVAHVRDGRVQAFEEYTDEASMQPLVQEFLAATAEPS